MSNHLKVNSLHLNQSSTFQGNFYLTGVTLNPVVDKGVNTCAEV